MADISSDRLIELTKHAALGSEPPKLTPDEREQFEKIRAEVASADYIIDLPHEWPDAE